MKAWILIFFGVLLLGHISGIFFGAWWKRWALKVAGFPNELVDFILWFTRASADFEWTDEEKKQGREKFNDVLEALAPPPLVQPEPPKEGP